MALSGPAPRERKIGRTPNAEWLDVVDEPYAGERPELPETRTLLDAFGVPHVVPLGELVREWWAIVSTMPQCALWTAADWAFAIDAALLKDAFYSSPGANVSLAVEVRRREDQLGTTVEARRKLRMRYVAADTVDEAPAEAPLETHTVKKLRELVRERGLRPQGRLTKAQLIELLEAAPPPVTNLADERRRRIIGAS